MFDILPNFIASILTIIFPIFASYKALRTSDPAQLSPWLMYWVSFALFTLFETYTYWFMGWIPFYGFFRLFLLAYLVLPQTQGARMAYQQYIHPFLAQHEARIDDFITTAHAKAKKAGLIYVEQLIDFIKKNIFRIPVQAQSRTSSTEGSYAQNLLSRFNLPAAREGLAAPAGDFYGLLSAAAGALGNRAMSRDVQAEELSRSGTLVPPHITTTAEKLQFVGAQREKLRMLLAALDKQATGLEIEKDVERRIGGGNGDGLLKSKSDASFDRIETVEAAEQTQVGAATGGNWMPWAWGGQKDTGSSSGVDI